MDNALYQNLYGKIVDLSDRGLIDWHRDDESDEFYASFSRSSLELASHDDPESRTPFLSVRNESGIPIAYYCVHRLDHFPETTLYIKQDVRPLYERVYKSVFKSDDTVESLMSELSKLDKANR